MDILPLITDHLVDKVLKHLLVLLHTQSGTLISDFGKWFGIKPFISITGVPSKASILSI